MIKLYKLLQIRISTSVINSELSGESFPLQENSSSYEYLPGHMIHDTRPPTVVSNRRSQGGRCSSSSNLSPTTSPSVQSSSSNAVVSSNLKQQAKKRPKIANDPSKFAYHLMEKSNQLHSAHVHQTMAYYSRLKEYIAYISEPSQSPADARVKQQMADKILDLMRQEEVKLNEKRPLSSLLGLSPDFLDEDTEEPTTRKIGDEPDHGDELLQDDNDQDPTSNLSLKSEESSMNTSNKGNETLQKLKILQMKKLRKEIRKLEKLEKVRLRRNSASSSVLAETEALKKLVNLSVDDSSLVSTSRTSSVCPPSESNIYRGIEGQSASGSDQKMPQKSVPRPSSLNEKEKKLSKRKPSVASVKEYCSGNNLVDSRSLQNGRQNGGKDGRTKTAKNAYPKTSEDFGQTFPTPRDFHVLKQQQKVATEKQSTNVEKAVNNQNRSNNSNSAKSSKIKRKPGPSVSAPKAYFLALNRQNVEDKENQSVPANLRKIDPQITLQDALLLKRPDFVQRSAFRTEVLKRKREQRLDYAEKYKTYLEQISNLPPKIRQTFRPPPRPEMPQLFNYKEMVEKTRQKYKKLPEIVYSRAEAKRKSSYKTNRLMADLYNTRLQKKVLQGHVSMAHHNQILQ